MDLVLCTSSFDFQEEDWTPFGRMDPDGDDPDTDSQTPEEAAAVREFCQAYNTPTPVPAAEAARRLMSLDGEERLARDYPEAADKGVRVAWMLWDVAMLMPQHQTAVLVLVDAVRALPRLDATPEQVAQFGEKALEEWRSLEWWTDIWHSQWERNKEDRYPGRSLDGAWVLRDWIRNCALTARYMVLHPPDWEMTVELCRAFWLIRFTLEHDVWNHVTPEEKQFGSTELGCRWSWSHERHITMLNTNVHSMVPFLKIAGDIIYRFTDREAVLRRLQEVHQENHPQNTREWCERLRTQTKPSRPGLPPFTDDIFLWKGDVWLTRDRWAFWKERLMWISRQPELLQRTRDEAVMLEQLMKDIEARES